MTAGRLRWVGGLAITLFVLAAWLGPRQLGGPVTYVVTTGSSMHPSLAAGDLVLVRPRSAYDVGDVVAYRSPLIDTIVLHRIVARDGDRFVLKGDANDFRDPDRPHGSDLLGTLWLRVPAAGNALMWARSPAGAGALVAALVVLASSTATRSTSRRRRRRAGGTGMAPGTGFARLDRSSTASSLTAAAIVFLALSAATFALPSATPPDPPGFTHRGAFAYTADTPVNAVYEDGRLGTGDPAFLSLVDRVDVTFTYGLETDHEHAVSGSAGMDAVVEGTNGWSATFPLGEPTPFQGDAVEVAAPLDLAEFRRRITEVEALTGVTGGAYTVTVRPRVKVRGVLAGQDLDSEFAPELVFQLDAALLRPVNDVAGEANAAGQDEAATFQPTEQGTVASAGTDGGHLALLGRAVPARPLRLGLLTLGLLTAAAAGLAWWPLRRPVAREATRVARRYGQAVIDVDVVDAAASRTQVQVASIDALLRLAERYDRMVLRQRTPSGHVYLVEDDGTVYRHEVRGQGSGDGADARVDVVDSRAESGGRRGGGAGGRVDRHGA